MTLGQPRSPTPAVSVIDILDRVLDKGLVIAGDISVSLANVELLTIRIRLLVCSIDKAEQIGLNWWRYDRHLVAPAAAAAGARPNGQALEDRITALEQQLSATKATARKSPRRTSRER